MLPDSSACTRFKGKAPNKITNNKIQFVLIVIKKFLWLFNMNTVKFVFAKINDVFISSFKRILKNLISGRNYSDAILMGW